MKHWPRISVSLLICSAFFAHTTVAQASDRERCASEVLTSVDPTRSDRQPGPSRERLPQRAKPTNLADKGQRMRLISDLETLRLKSVTKKTILFLRENFSKEELSSAIHSTKYTIGPKHRVTPVLTLILGLESPSFDAGASAQSIAQELLDRDRGRFSQSVVKEYRSYGLKSVMETLVENLRQSL